MQITNFFQKFISGFVLAKLSQAKSDFLKNVKKHQAKSVFYVKV